MSGQSAKIFRALCNHLAEYLKVLLLKNVYFFLFSHVIPLRLKSTAAVRQRKFHITNQAVLVGVTKPLKNAALFSRYLAIISFTPYNAVFMFLEASPA